MNKEFLEEESIFKIGRVISIEGRTVRVIVNKNKNTSHILYNGDLVKNVTVGGYVKIIKGFINIVGKVEGERTNEDKIPFEKEEYANNKAKINRVLQISLIGFIDASGFQRGIKELPLIDNECYLLKNDEFNSIHNFIKSKDIGIEIGKLSLESNHPIKVGVNSLFASHIGIFGNTGSGKSYTLAKLYRQLFLHFIENNAFNSNGRFYFLDFNGEYVDDDVIIEKQYKDIYNLSTRTSNSDKYPLSIAQIKDTTFWSILSITSKMTRIFLNMVQQVNPYWGGTWMN